MKDQTRLTINVGIEAVTYPTGDLLNALNEVVCHFETVRQITPRQIIGALELYIDELKEVNEVEVKK